MYWLPEICRDRKQYIDASIPFESTRSIAVTILFGSWSWAKDYTYGEGTLSVLDDYVLRTVLFCIASKLTQEQKITRKEAFRKTCEQMNFNKL